MAEPVTSGQIVMVSCLLFFAFLGAGLVVFKLGELTYIIYTRMKERRRVNKLCPSCKRWHC